MSLTLMIFLYFIQSNVKS